MLKKVTGCRTSINHNYHMNQTSQLKGLVMNNEVCRCIFKYFDRIMDACVKNTCQLSRNFTIIQSVNLWECYIRRYNMFLGRTVCFWVELCVSG